MFVVKSVISEPIFIDKKEFEKLSKVLKDPNDIGGLMTILKLF